MAGPDVDEPEEFGVRLRWPSDDPDAITERPLRARRDAPPTAVEDDEAGRMLAVRSAGGPDNGREGTESDMLPAVLPAMVGRMETVHGAIATLSMRIDGLVTATNNIRSTISDRITDYAETMAHLARSQASDLDEYRHGTERVTGELRRSLAESDDGLRHLSARVEEIAGDVTMFGDLLRSHQGDNREVLAASEQLVRSVTDGLDDFGRRVLDGLENTTTATGGVTAVVRAEMSTLRRELQELRRSRFDVNLLAEIRSEVASLTDTVKAGEAPLEAMAAACEAIKGARTELRADLAAATTSLLQEQLDGIEQLRAQVEHLQADEARSHRIVPEVVRALTEEMAQLRDQLTRDRRAAVNDALAEHGSVRVGATGGGSAEGDAGVLRDEVRAVLAEELDPVREELKSLRRRLGVRAKPPALTDAQLALLADAVVAATATAAPAASAEAHLSDPQLETLAEIVVDRLERSLELVEDDDGADTNAGRASGGEAEGSG